MSVLAALVLFALQAHDPPRVADLPRADLGRWSAWEAAPPQEQHGAYLEAAGAYYAGDWIDAEARMHRILTEAPDYPAAMYLLGIVEYRLRRRGEAVVAFERFLAHAPEHVGRTRHLGHCLYGLGRYEEALEHYDRVLAAEPGDWEARRGRALTCFRLLRFDEAAAGLRAVLEAQPGDADALYWLAQVEFERDEETRARAHARQAQRAAPHDPRVAFLLAQLAFDDEERAAARAKFERLEALAARSRGLENQLLFAPRDFALWRALVELRAEAGDAAGLSEACARMLRAAEYAGDSVAAYWARRRAAEAASGR